MTAMPWPPPMQAAPRPYRPPRRRSAWSRCSGDAGAARAERVAQGDGAAVDVGALAVEAELPLDGQVLGGEGLVDLDQVHVVQREARALQRARAPRAPDRCP